MLCWGSGSLAPLGCCRGADLLGGSWGWSCAGTGTRGGITARLRPWPLGNQVSIWPRSGPSFPIPALIRGIARYYSFHNNVPVRGLGRGEGGGTGLGALAMQCPPAVLSLPAGPPELCTPGYTRHRPLQGQAAEGTGSCLQSPCPACRSPLSILEGPNLTTAGAGGQGWMAPSHHPKLNQKINPHHSQFRKILSPGKIHENTSKASDIPFVIIPRELYRITSPHRGDLNKCPNLLPDPSPSVGGTAGFPQVSPSQNPCVSEQSVAGPGAAIQSLPHAQPVMPGAAPHCGSPKQGQSPDFPLPPCERLRPGLGQGVPWIWQLIWI